MPRRPRTPGKRLLTPARGISGRVPARDTPCLEETLAWFEEAHPEAKAEHPHLFAESVCAVPPPQYTNVPD